MRLIVICLSLAIALASCGGPAGPPTETPTLQSSAAAATVGPSGALIDIDIEAAVDRTVAAETAVIESYVVIEAASSVPVTMHVQGQVSFSSQQIRMSMTGSIETLDGIDLIIDGRIIYARGFDFPGVPGWKWLRVDKDATDRTSQAFASVGDGSSDASLALYYFYGTVPGTIRDAGRDKVLGFDVQRVASTCDLDLALDNVPTAVRAMLTANIAKMRAQGFVDAVMTCEAAIDDEGRITNAAFHLNAPTIANISSDYTFSEFGKELDLGIPTGDDVLKAEDLDLGG